MGAREKINASYTTGIVLLAAYIGAVAQSWLVFGVGLGVLYGLNVVAGNIRPVAMRRH